MRYEQGYKYHNYTRSSMEIEKGYSIERNDVDERNEEMYVVNQWNDVF